MHETSHEELLAALDESPDISQLARRVAALEPERRQDFVGLVRSHARRNLETRLWILRIARNEPFLETVRLRFDADGASLHSPLAGAISSVG